MNSQGDTPATRWDLAGSRRSQEYAARFASLIETGEDIDGEARLTDTLAPRGARILDAGSGMGRVAAALARRGHQVLAVEKDPRLVEESRERFPDIPVLRSDVLDLTPDSLAEAGHPTPYDVVVAVGNVVIYAAEDTERDLLTRLADLLTPTGRMLIGFHTDGSPGGARPYPPAEFLDDVTDANLVLQHRFGSYQLDPPSEDYVVAILSRI